MLVLFPTIAGIVGGIAAQMFAPPAALLSGVQHFAAGIVMAAVAGEVLPELRERGALWPIVVGFSAGVALLILLRHVEPRDTGTPGKLPTGLITVVAVDLLVDGLLVGSSAAVSTRTAVIITIALTAEVLFLGLTVGLQLAEAQVNRLRGALTTTALSLTVAVGAIVGAVVLTGVGSSVLSLVLAFAAAALLWLVVEELLVEAHEVPERPWTAAMFFIGFLALFCLEPLQ